MRGWGWEGGDGGKGGRVPAIRHGPLEPIDPVSLVNGIFLLVHMRLRSSICSNNVEADSWMMRQRVLVAEVGCYSNI